MKTKTMFPVVLFTLTILACGGYPVTSTDGSDGDAAFDGASQDAYADATPETAVDAPFGIHPGDLVKDDCNLADPDGGRPCSTAVYYIGTDLRRYVFPNEYTYFSWYPDFTTVRRIPWDTLINIPLGGNVTMRPGTWLVKITTDPKVYVVTRCGVLHWIVSEALATQLYGPDWRLRVKDVPDGFFANYMPDGLITTPIHADGTLIRYADAPDVIYVMDMGSRRRFEPGAFEANRFRSEFIVTTTIVYPDGSPVTGREPQLEETVCVGIR